jgi:bifunctional non-homologous end joining protein LigD
MDPADAAYAPARRADHRPGSVGRIALEEYKRKRDPAKTPEPSGSGTRRRAAAKPRFVIQQHDATRLHWDLRLEHEGVLASWAIPNFLPDAPRDNRLAVHTEDHPIEYLDFHGEIPKGQYGAGTMTIFDRGTYDVLKWEPRKIEVDLHGERISGRYALFPLDKGEGKDWMIHRMDPPADPSAEPMPEVLEPMLATSGSLPRDDGRWAYEIKWDGIRVLVHSRPGRMALKARSLRDVTDRYPELARLNRALGHHAAILDGEIVAFDADGKPSFNAIQRRIHLTSDAQVRRLARESPVTYVVFDLVWLDGHPLYDEPYERRRERLKALLGDGGERWRVPDHVVGRGAEVLAATAQQGLEGVIAKRLDARYEPGRRSSCWIKIKHKQREDLVVGGWLPGEGRRRERIGALLLGAREPDGRLRFAGRVGTGFTEAELDRLRGILGPLEQPRSPFTAGDKPPRESVFVAPDLLAEVEFVEWTPDGKVRAPSYKGLVETEVPLKNPDKVLWPVTGFTKRDMRDFYARVAHVLLPHLAGRALTRIRLPDGVGGQQFYEKNAPPHTPDWVPTARVGDIDYIVAEDRRTLLWLANLAAIELHPSLARADAPLRPTVLAFDLDPGPPATIVECCQVALFVQAMFTGLGLQAFPKTSGSKGLQVYVPLNHPDATFDQTKRVSKMVAELLEREEPGLVVSKQTKALRPGKVLVDWSQNDDAKTTVAVYSLRARERPTVSTPVTWNEVRECAESGDPGRLVFDAAAVVRRVEEHGDLYAPVLSVVQALPG